MNKIEKDHFIDTISEAGLDYVNPLGRRNIKNIVRRLVFLSHPFILDIGCGRGIFSIEMARFVAAKCIGIDLRPDVIRRAWECARKHGVDSCVDFRVGDVATDVPAGYFDLVVLLGTVWILGDCRNIIRSLRSIGVKAKYVLIGERVLFKPRDGIEKLLAARGEHYLYFHEIPEIFKNLGFHVELLYRARKNRIIAFEKQLLCNIEKWIHNNPHHVLLEVARDRVLQYKKNIQLYSAGTDWCVWLIDTEDDQ